MKKLFSLLIGILLSITVFGQLKQVEVPDTTTKDTVYVEQKSTIIYNYYDTQDSWYNYSPFHFSWYYPTYYSWYTPYYYDWYMPYNYNWYGYYSPYYNNWYTKPYYNHHNHYSHYNTNYYGHRNVSGGYKPVNRDNHSRYQYQKPMEYKPLYDHSQRHGIMPKYNESRPTPKYNSTRVRQHLDLNPDNTRYRTPQPQRTYKPSPVRNYRPDNVRQAPANNPRPAMDRPQQRNYDRPAQQRSNDRPSPSYNAPQRSSSPQPSSRPAPSNPAPSRMPNSSGQRR